MQARLVTRRRMLATGGALALGALLPGTAAARALQAPERALNFFNAHTGEVLKTVYWADGRYLPSARRAINRILRDWRTEEVVEMDAGLLDYLYALRRTVESSAPFHVISGYRSPATNAMLRRESKGVAKRSLHMRGKAIDVRLPDRELRALAQAARGLGLGGVGYYPQPGFIHIDTGRVRSW